MFFFNIKMRNYLVFLVLLVATLAEGFENDIYPAIAMYCGKNTQYRDLHSGKWITDPSGQKDCMENNDEMIQYCQQVYKSLNIVNVVKQTDLVKIPAWCALGHPGPVCKGHGHSVHLVKCMTSDINPLDGKCTSSSVHSTQSISCKGKSYWIAKAHEACKSMKKVLSDNYNTVEPCEEKDKFNGLEFVCCEKNIVVTNVMPVDDPVCTQPMLVGLCRAAFSRWYFNKDTLACEHFIYGGCGGNENQFSTKEDCEKRCSPPTVNSEIDPLLDMELGPVIPDVVETTTVASKKRGLAKKPSDSYFHAPLGMNNELELFSEALMDENKQHDRKLNSVMHEWSSAKSDLQNRGSSKENLLKLNQDMLNEVSALKSEHSKKREQIISVHQARVDASLVGRRTDQYNDFINKLNNPDTQPDNVLEAFKRYLQSEKNEMRHTKKQLDRTDDHESATILQNKLSQIQDRVNRATQLLAGRGLTSELKQKPDDVAADFFPEFFSSFKQPQKNSTSSVEVIYIDNGGLPPEIFVRTYATATAAFVFPIGLIPSDCAKNYKPYNDEITNIVIPNDDESFSDETPPPLPPADFDVNDMDVVYPYADLDYVYSKKVSEASTNWLLWTCVGGMLLICFVLTFVVVYIRRNRFDRRHRFARVEIEEQLTPEDKQLLQMQQNGYENPTYKFFEKQRRA